MTLRIFVTLTPPMVERLAELPFGLEEPGEIQLAKHGLHPGQIHTEAGELLLQSLRQMLTDNTLLAATRRAVKARIEHVEAMLDAHRRIAHAHEDYEWVRGEGQIAVELLGDDVELLVPHQVELIEKWAEFDPDVREHVTAIRNALAVLQEAVAKLKEEVDK